MSGKIYGKIWESGEKTTAAASIRTARPRQAKETRRTSDQQDDYPHAAAADKDAAATRAGISDVCAGDPGIRPEGAYTIYPCNQDIVDYFRLRSPRPILWVDIDFTPVGIAHMRLKRSSTDLKVSRTINIHAHAYYRLQSLSPNHGIAKFLDDLVDFYLEKHPHLLRPVSSSEV